MNSYLLVKVAHNDSRVVTRMKSWIMARAEFRKALTEQWKDMWIYDESTGMAFDLDGARLI